MRRRDFLLGSGAAVGALTAGCAETLAEGLLRYEAGQAYLPESVARGAGYEEVDRTDLVVERTVEVGDESRTVEVVNWLARYERDADAQPADDLPAVFGVVATPRVEVLDRTLNPVAEYSIEEVADLVQDRYDEIRRLESRRESTVTILGEDTTETRFSGEVALEAGAAIDVSLHVSDPVERDEDFVISLGGYPQGLADEGATVRTMMESIEYETA